MTTPPATRSLDSDRRMSSELHCLLQHEVGPVLTRGWAVTPLAFALARGHGVYLPIRASVVVAYSLMYEQLD